MQRFTTREGIPVAYQDHYFGPPWRADAAESVVLIHGTSESSQVWYAWVTALAAQYRVIRPDLPGFGQSRLGENADYDWSAHRIGSDLLQLLDHLGIARAHLVGAKYGGCIGTDIALHAPQRVRTLTVIAGPMGIDDGPSEVDVHKFSERIASDHAGWVRDTMAARLGSGVDPAQRDWLERHMSPSDPRAARGCAMGTVHSGLASSLHELQVPTLFITTEGNRMVPVETYARWAATIPDARLEVVHGDGYHPAVSHPDECAAAVLKHIGRAPA